jgi:CheY-like chemotaxis protein
MLPRVFELFTQAENSRHRAQGGLGIGLTLVQHLLEMHHGRVEARSEGEGRGSEFVVRLPLVDTAAADSRPDQPLEQTQRRPGRILVVDDNRDAADSLGLLLEGRGIEVRVVYDALTALATLQEFGPDVVLLDLGMPGMSGVEAAREIRKQDHGRNVKLVAVTGWGQDEDRRQTVAAGFDRHLVKPVDFSVLLGVLDELEADVEKPMRGSRLCP